MEHYLMFDKFSAVLIVSMQVIYTEEIYQILLQ